MIANNQAIDGGGVSNFENATIINSTINDNSASDGGGIYSNSGTIGLNNVTISGNTADFTQGGGIYLTDSTANIVNSTITDNTAIASSLLSSQGGGLYASNSATTLRNTLVAGNEADEGEDLWVNVATNLNNDGSNLISNSDIQGVERNSNINPRLGLLQNNGGLTFTHALLDGSPAINAGNNANVAADSIDIDGDGNTGESIPFEQRGSGFLRIADGTVDIGAFEAQIGIPQLSINDITAIDDPEGLSNAVVTVTLSIPSSTPVTVQYTTQDNSAVAGIDYIAVVGTLTFNSGETTANITVPIIADTLVEPNEAFLFNLFNANNAGILDTQGVEMITNLDSAQYGASYGDLIQGIGYNLDALRQHYYISGRFEGRQSDLFDEFRYIASNSDLIPAYSLNGAAATEHYIRYGYFERRSLTGFDPARYLNSYNDLLGAYGRNTQAATEHYITNGFAEGRTPNLFPSDRYIASYNDLLQTFRYNLEAGSNHYLYSGRSEGRQILFDPVAYLNRYSDLQAAFGNDLTAATAHYITVGFDEGRTWG